MTSRFPDPIPLPEEVEEERKERCRAIVQSVKMGSLIRLAIIALEFGGALAFGSATLFLDALSSSIDILSSILLIIFIRLAARAPDEEHPFGHGRYEPLAGLHLSLFLLFVGCAMALNQSISLYEIGEKEPFSHYLWLLPATAVCLLEVGYRRIKAVAIRTKSPALLAEAVHFRVDLLTSAIALLALLFASIFPERADQTDHIGALLIAFTMAGLGFASAKKNGEQLMDRRPDEKYFLLVKKAALSIDGVKDTEKVKIQLFGPDAHVNVDVEVDPTLSVFEAHAISQRVRAEVQKEWPAVRDVIVHIEPFFPNDH